MIFQLSVFIEKKLCVHTYFDDGKNKIIIYRSYGYTVE